MIDLYLDEMSLVRVEQKHGAQVLLFKNDAKDEALSIPVSNDELLNIYQRVKIRCETLELIPK